jgi:hypothetical protein
MVVRQYTEGHGASEERARDADATLESRLHCGWTNALIACMINREHNIRRMNIGRTDDISILTT